MRQIDDIRLTQKSDEVELDAQELLGMAEPARAASSSVAEPDSVVEPVIATTVAELPAKPRKSVLPIAAGVCIALTALAATAGLYKSSTNEPVARAISTTWHPQPEAVIETVELTQPVEPPVKFANPFDKSEVFEFPAGTSRAEARDAVAEILMQRAAERGASGRAARR